MPGGVQVVEGNGQGNTFPQNVDDSYSAPAGVYDTLVNHPDGTWTLTRKNRVKWNFNSAGWLVSLQDRNNNQVSLSYDSTNHLQSVTDATGVRSLLFTWDSTK